MNARVANTSWRFLLVRGIPLVVLFPLVARPYAAPALDSHLDLGGRGDPAIARLLEETIDKQQLPGGMVGGIVYRGDLLAVGAAGVRKQGTDVEMAIGDQLHLGSCTKAMTATVAASLVQERQLRWESTLPELLPEVSMHPAFREVTLTHLLSHQAGLPRNGGGMIGPDWSRLLAEEEESDRQRRREMVRRELQKAPAGPLGHYTYSNLGYVVAGHILEEKTDTAWQTLMRQRLFQPLKMTSAGFGPPGEAGKLEQPWGHMKVPLVGTRPLQRDNPSFIGPAGTVHCSLLDWAKFASLHLGHANGAKPLLAKETLERLHRPVGEADYALGWKVAQRPWAKGTTLTHGGSNTMWYAVIWVAPQIDAAFLVVCNSGGAFEACDQAISGMIQELQRREQIGQR